MVSAQGMHDQLTTTGTLNQREDLCLDWDLRLNFFCNKKFINWHFENLLNDTRRALEGGDGQLFYIFRNYFKN